MEKFEIKWYLWLTVLLQCNHLVNGEKAMADVSEMRVEMPKVETDEEDAYMCVAYDIKDVDADLVGYRIDAVQGVIHHVAFAVCEDVASDIAIWNCRSQQGSICKGRSTNVGAWNHWKGDTFYNSDVGIHLGAAEKFNILLLQAHIKDVQPSPDLQQSNPANLTLYLSSTRRPYTTQMLSFVSTGYIPGHAKNFSSDMAYIWKGVPVTAMAYSIHAHSRGNLVEGYLIRNGEATLIGRGKPHIQHRDRRNLLSGPLDIYPGDMLAARCLFTNNDAERVKFGMTSHDEMCNFSIFFKYDAHNALAYKGPIICESDAQISSWCTLPETNMLCNA